MITAIHLKNFKAFRDVTLDLKPITVLAGANSAGKSSIIQALLILKQTLEGRRERSLSLHGEYMNFSRYEELVFGHKQDEAITFGLERRSASLPEGLTRKRLATFFSEAELAIIFADDHKEKIRSRYDISFHASVQGTGDVIQIKTLVASSVLAGLERRQVACQIRRDGETYQGSITIPESQSGLTPTCALRQKEPHKSPWRYFFPEGFTYQHRAKWPPLPADLLALPEFHDDLSDHLHYVGPIRTEPQRAYMMLGDRLDLDFRGDNTAQILVQEANELVEYPDVAGGAIRRVRFLDAVNETLRLVGLQQSIEPVTRDGRIAQLLLGMIGDTTRNVTIVDVGFGVSQLLPIVVACLRAARGDTLIFEQPETHLHPRLQAGLADFFILLRNIGKRVIVETHSDHIINGLRMRIAEDPSDTLAKDIEVAFVRPPVIKDEGSRIEQLEFDDFGMISNWPPEFMSESMKQAQQILRLGVEKQRRRRLP